MAATGFPQDTAALLARLRDRLAAREDVVGVYVARPFPGRMAEGLERPGQMG